MEERKRESIKAKKKLAVKSREFKAHGELFFCVVATYVVTQSTVSFSALR